MAQVASDDTPHPAIAFIAALFSGTEQPIFFQTLANDPADLDEARYKPHLLTRDVAPIIKFVGKHDRKRRGMFFCVATVAEGSSTRNKETVRETVCLHADLDFKGIVEDEPTIWAAIAKLRYQPTVIVRSGGGLHLYWVFRESINSQEYREVIEIALKAMAEILAGDLAVGDVCRLMRLPGTYNSKRGDMREVVCERLDGPRYELDEIEEWISEQQPVLTRKPVEPRAGRKADPEDAASQGEPDNPYLRHAREWGYKPRLDVEAALAGMTEGNVHDTQIRVAASLIHAGQPVEEVVGILMEATRKVGQPDWNWRTEEKIIRKACESAAKKFPPKPEPDVSHERAEVIDLGVARSRLKPKPRGPPALLAPFVVADGVIETLRGYGRDIMLAEGEVWIYGAGFWRVMTPVDQQLLLTEIQRGFEALREPGKTGSLNSCWKRINEHPDLFKADVPWASGSAIVCRNGVLPIETGHFEGHRPENYARRSIGTEYLEWATCPRFEALLYTMLGRADLIDLVQEWLGAALSIGSLNREERRALLLVGPSRTGKTELAKIFSLLFGGPIATPSVAAVSDDRDRFALSSLYGASAWVRDDAINEGDKLNPQRFKTIVTGEPVDIEVKHRPAVPGYRFEIPVCLTANSLPKAIDGSDAIFNRSLILRMENVIDDEAAAKARVDAGLRPGQSIGSAIFEAEGPGILNWALVGLARLRARGFYDIPQSVKDAISRFKDDNNPIGEWAREAIKADPHSKVERRDLVRSYNGWQFEQEGQKAEGRGGRWLMPKLRNQVPGISDIQGNGGMRYVAGLKLTELGLSMWKSYGEANPHGGAGGCAAVVTDVNKVNEVHKNDGWRVRSHAPDEGSDIPF